MLPAYLSNVEKDRKEAIDIQIDVITIIVTVGVILLTAGALTAGMLWSKKRKERVRRLGMPEKIQMINELTEPLGFFYEASEDVFTSCRNAWQRKQGYEALYDRMAPSMNMILEAWPVYFDYSGKTWLIELWKGQYGINTGGEVGVYHAKRTVSPDRYSVTHFDSVPDEEMPLIQCRLERAEQEIYTLYRRHWWLTGFHMGTFSRPANLRMFATLTFQEPEMAQAFYTGLVDSGVPETKYRIWRNSVYVRMDADSKQAAAGGIYRRWVQFLNHLYCWLYACVTYPFTNTVDRMLYLYFLVPYLFGRMLRFREKIYLPEKRKIWYPVHTWMKKIK